MYRLPKHSCSACKRIVMFGVDGGAGNSKGGTCDPIPAQSQGEASAGTQCHRDGCSPPHRYTAIPHCYMYCYMYCYMHCYMHCYTYTAISILPS